MSQPGNTAPSARRCRRCDAPALDDSDFCGPHETAERERVKLALRKLRQRRRRQKRCAWCPNKAVPGQTLCAACKIKHDRAPAAVETKVETAGRDRIASRTTLVTEGDGRTRSRYRGKHRGRTSVAEMDAEDVRAVRSSLQRFEDGLAYARSDEVADLPKIQRDEAMQAALSHADVARRFLEELLERHRYPMERNRPHADE